MMCCWGAWILVTFSTLIWVHESAEGSCSLPAAWRSGSMEYLDHYDREGDVPWVTVYEEENAYFQQFYVGSIRGPVIIEFVCLSSFEKNGKHYHIRKLRYAAQYYCVESVTQGDLAIIQRARQLSQEIPASACPNEINSAMPATWFVKYPLPTLKPCPFQPGKYQATFVVRAGGVTNCAGDPDSFVLIRVDDNQMEFRTCEAKSTYERPLYTTLGCVAEAPGSDLGQENNGNLLLLKYKDFNGHNRFYCARYKDEGNTVELSLNIQNRKEVYCDPLAAYNTVREGKYIAFILKKEGSLTTPISGGGTPTTPTVPTPAVCHPVSWGADSLRWWYEQQLNMAHSAVLGQTEYRLEEISTMVYQGTVLDYVDVCLDSYRSDLERSLSVTYREGGSRDDRMCVALEHINNIILERRIDVNVGVSAFECGRKLNSVTNVRVLVQLPWTYGSSDPYNAGPGYRCPIPDGIYFVSYSESSEKQNECKDDEKSSATVDGDKITLNACTASYVYDKPYRGELRCIQDWNAAWIDPLGNSKGNFMLLARVLTNGASATGFYCTRFRMEGGKIYLSLDVGDNTKIICNTSATYREFGDEPGHKYRAFTFSSSLGDSSTGGGGGNFVTPSWTDPPGCTRTCLNGGRCIVNNGTSTCDCRPGTFGIQCEKALPRGTCSSFPCSNATSISCKDDRGYYFCLCKPGYEGPQCQVDTDECLSSPCQNGGTCVDGLDRYECVCEENFLGPRCEEEVVVAFLKKHDSTIIVVLVAVLSVFVLACIAIAILICQCRNKKIEAKAVEERLKITEDVGQPGLDNLPGQSYASFQAWYPDYKTDNTYKSEDTYKDTLKKNNKF